MQFNNKQFGDATKPYAKSPYGQDFISATPGPTPPPGSEIMVCEDGTIMVCEDGTIMITE